MALLCATDVKNRLFYASWDLFSLLRCSQNRCLPTIRFQTLYLGVSLMASMPESVTVWPWSGWSQSSTTEWQIVVADSSSGDQCLLSLVFGRFWFCNLKFEGSKKMSDVFLHAPMVNLYNTAKVKWDCCCCYLLNRSLMINSLQHILILSLHLQELWLLCKINNALFCVILTQASKWYGFWTFGAWLQTVLCLHIYGFS